MSATVSASFLSSSSFLRAWWVRSGTMLTLVNFEFANFLVFARMYCIAPGPYKHMISGRGLSVSFLSPALYMNLNPVHVHGTFKEFKNLYHLLNIMFLFVSSPGYGRWGLRNLVYNQVVSPCFSLSDLSDYSFFPSSLFLSIDSTFFTTLSRVGFLLLFELLHVYILNLFCVVFTKKFLKTRV